MSAKRVAMHYCRTVCSPCLPNALHSITTEPDAALVCQTRGDALQYTVEPYAALVCQTRSDALQRNGMHAALVCLARGDLRKKCMPPLSV
jgi:hypothetical protein